MCLWVLQHNLGGWHIQETITQTMNSDVELCLFSAFCAFQFRGWPLPVVRYFALWEPLSVCEQGPDEGPQGLPARWSHQAALLQVAERAPTGGGRARHSGQEGPISGGEWDHEKRGSRLKEGSITKLTLFSFVCFPRVFPAMTPLSKPQEETHGTSLMMKQRTGAPMKYHNTGCVSTKSSEDCLFLQFGI